MLRRLDAEVCLQERKPNSCRPKTCQVFFRLFYRESVVARKQGLIGEIRFIERQFYAYTAQSNIS